MGRKTEKSQRKQARLKEEKKQLALAYNNVKMANLNYEPLSMFPAFGKYCRNGLDLNLECKRIKDVPPDTIKLLFGILKKNMERYYRSCDWGWDEDKKFAEMTEDAAWYLIAYDHDKNPVAFSHFRFDMDFGLDVLYVYEIHLIEEVRRKGLGKFMSQLLELVAFKHNFKKVILTVFKHNPETLEFYRSLKYTMDETSPEDDYEEQFCYFILSKPNKSIST